MNTRAEDFRRPLTILTLLFFMWGLITSLNDILIPHLKRAFDLTYVEAMLIQFCFFGAYFVMSLPSGRLVHRFGYKVGIIVGVLIAAAGCLLFYPAAQLHLYALFLGALFVLASGITLLQVAANPYVAMLGRLQTAASRMNLTAAFNSLGTTIGPYLGSLFILSSAAAVVAGPSATAAQDADTVKVPYVALATILALIALLISQSRLPPVQDMAASDKGNAPGSIWSRRHLVLGTLAIFVYVGGEVSIGSFLVNFMGQSNIAALPAELAGKYVSLYWGGAMIGRFVGSAVMRKVPPQFVLAFNATGVVALLILGMSTAGPTAMWAFLAIGLFNSIMFPTIFTLAIRGLGPLTGDGSGLLCMAIVGGALVPVLQGWAADHLGILISFVVPLICYLYIIYYGLRGHIVRGAIGEPVVVTSRAAHG